MILMIRNESAQSNSAKTIERKSSKMQQENKRSDIQEIVWNIMKDIMPIISKHGIRYYMLGGTLLGAIRHKGFIPWDDDIDIGMPREDYERFLKIVSEELPSYLELNTYWDESPHHYYFSRIVDTRHELKRTGSTKERNEYIWVDIFPLDGMPNNPVSRRIHMMKLLYARARYHIASFDKVNLKRPGRPFSERIVIWFVFHTGIGTKSDPKKWLDRIDRLLKKYSINDTNWVCNFMGQYKFKEMFPKTWYGDGTLYDFEESQMIGPIEYDKILTQQYGDYMTPPKEKNTHAVEFIE